MKSWDYVSSCKTKNIEEDNRIKDRKVHFCRRKKEQRKQK